MPCAVHKTSDFHDYDCNTFGNFYIYELSSSIARILVLSFKRYTLTIANWIHRYILLKTCHCVLKIVLREQIRSVHNKNLDLSVYEDVKFVPPAPTKSNILHFSNIYGWYSNEIL